MGTMQVIVPSAQLNDFQASDSYSSGQESVSPSSSSCQVIQDSLYPGDGISSQPFLYRLFVGWVPRAYSEQDLIPLFSPYGEVKDVRVLKDKVSGNRWGFAFVSFATKEEAELAIQKLDRQIQLPGAQSLLEVRFAKSHQYVQAGDGPEDNRQLFFSFAPQHLTEQDLSIFFSQFGVVEETNLFRERKTGVSKGCGFVTMQTRAQAMQAMETLASKSAEPSKDITVQWADPELQAKKKKALEQSNADNRMLFFAKVLRSANEEEVKRLFSQYGKVYDVNLFRAFQGAPTTKGCGLVTMGSHEEARNAIEGLDNKYCWEGMDSPMVVKWMDAALQRRRREQHLAALRQGLMPSMAAAAGHDAWFPQQLALAGRPRPAGFAGPALLLQEPEMLETPPAGCNPDAIKLFVGNIPKSCTEEQLLPFFETIGKVAELVIVRDKTNHQSKGSAFVWYVMRAHAERAILQFNLRHVLPDPAGEQDRPLVVRKARVRATPKSLLMAKPDGLTPTGLAGPTAQNHPAVNMLTGGAPHIVSIPAQHQPAFFSTGTPGSGSAGPSKLVGGLAIGSTGSNVDVLPTQAISMQPGNSANASYVPITTSGGMYRTLHQVPGGAQLVSIQAAPNISESGLYEAYGPGSGEPGAGMERYMIAAQLPGQVTAAQNSAADSMAPLALSLPLNVQQMSMVNNHLFSVQNMSGAQINTSPGAHGLFHLLISGTKQQVESARNLISSVLGQAII